MVNNLVNANQPSGYKSVQWNATNNQGQPVSAEFFRSIDGKKFYKEQLIGNNGYWSISFNKKSKTVSIPIMITQEMRMRLKGLKYSSSDIRYFTPQQAHDIIKSQIINKNPSLNHGRNQ